MLRWNLKSIIMKDKMTGKPYIPISCNLYDEFEALATLRKRVHIHYHDQELKTCAEGIIKDFKVRDKVEYMMLDTGLEIRL